MCFAWFSKFATYWFSFLSNQANKYQPNLILSIARSTTGEMSAPAQVVRMQSWTEDVKKKIPNASPIARSIELRTEFSGACTAEYAVQAAASICDDAPTVKCTSMGDWSSAARYVAEMNCPDTCRFKNIMSLVSDEMQKKLTAEKKCQAGSCAYKCWFALMKSSIEVSCLPARPGFMEKICSSCQERCATRKSSSPNQAASDSAILF